MRVVASRRAAREQTMVRGPLVDVPLQPQGGRMREADRSAERRVREIYDAHYGALAGWAARLVGDQDLGHDFATEAFVRLLRDESTVQDPRAWLYTVTANLVRDHWRKRGRESAAYGRAAAGSDGTAVSGPDTATQLTVREVVLSLPDGLRLPVLLHYYADLPVAVVAARLGKSEGTVKRDLFDARKRMAARLEDVR